MSSPSRHGTIYRVSYRRPNWKEGVWKYKLFNSPGAAEKYVDNITKAPGPDTPEKFAHLKPAEAHIHFGAAAWHDLPFNPSPPDSKRQSYRMQYAKAHDGELPTEAELDYWIELLQEDE